VVTDLDLTYLQPLYEAYQRHTWPEMGDRASALFVLKHSNSRYGVRSNDFSRLGRATSD